MEQEMFNRYTPSRAVITEKYNKNLAAQNFFMQFFDDFKFGANDNYPDWTFWMTKDEKFFMCLNPKNRELWVDYYTIWQKLGDNFGMKYEDIQSFIQHQVLHIVNLRSVTPKEAINNLVRCYTL